LREIVSAQVRCPSREAALPDGVADGQKARAASPVAGMRASIVESSIAVDYAAASKPAVPKRR
jgi:hypothetical protein